LYSIFLGDFTSFRVFVCRSIHKAEQKKAQRATNLKRQYLFSINFAVNNKSSEIAPYIALADLYDTKKSYLDTIYNGLTPAIAFSKYGLILENFIANLGSRE
jgi:hypothetical protein